MTVGRNRTYFISDIHLGARYIPDRRAHEQAVCRFLRSIAPTARRIFMVGDILDYWYEYRTVVPRGYVRFFGVLAELADSGVEIVWFTGNHDIWLFDYLRDELGICVTDPRKGYELTDIDGTLFCIGHGDAIGPQKPGFRFIRSLFRNRVCQWMYAAIHPRWTVGFAHAWSSHSRKGCHTPQSLEPAARTGLELFCRKMATEHPGLRYVVVGHHHVPVDEPVSADCRLIVLGDWLSRHTYAVFDGESLKLCEFDPQVK